MKAKKLRKVLLSFALSTALLAEPLAGVPMVYAKEAQMDDQSSEIDENSDEGTIDDQAEVDDSIEQTESGDTDTDAESEEGNDNAGEEDSDVGRGKEDGPQEENSEDSEDGSQEENNEEIDEETDGELDEEESLDEEVNEDADEDDLGDFSDMPSEYKLNASQMELKADLSGMLKQLNESDEGVTYAERQIFTFVDSQEDAEMIAEAFHAEIIDFQMGVLTMKLSEGKTVKSALEVAADMDNNLPAVWPDFQRQLYGEIDPSAESGILSDVEVVEEEYSIDDTYAETNEDDIPTLETYEQVLNELDGFNDEYLKPTNARYQWFHTTIGSPYAWDAGYKGKDIKVGVIDSGIDSNTDLSSNVIDNKGFVDGTGVVNDYTPNGAKHGTHVAGIIAALGNGSMGVGVAPEAKIYNAKVFGNDTTKSGYDSTIIAAINYLISEEGNTERKEVDPTPAKVDIINMSLGGPGRNPAFQFVLDKAYKKGVVVFAATGNDGGSLMQYPASYNHVIGVAATDTNNQRAYFSNYGSSTDLSAPGVDIWSTYSNDYKSMQGTSMACPVAAGEAAVILSGKDALPSLKDKTGKARVDALESIMKGNTISAGSGMGKGITSLPKVFKLSTAATKPKAPVIEFDKAKTDNEHVTITITAQAGMKLCYTTNGKNPALKNGVPDANTTLIDKNVVTLSFDSETSAKTTVKAFAINASGVIGPVKSYSYKLSPYVKTIEISGSKNIEQGKSVQLSAKIGPTYATNKKVTWSLDNENAAKEAGVTINGSGKVTVTKTAETGSYTVRVTAQDAGKKSVTYPIQVVKANSSIQSLSFDAAKSKDLKEIWIPNNKSVDLSSALVAKEKNDAGELVEIKTGLNGRIQWTSSKPAVASVDSNGKVTASSAGTTTITVKANDSGNKKATISITVKQAVTSITITDSKGQTEDKFFTVAAGKSLTLKASLNPNQAKPSNNKVIWTLDNEETANAEGVSINKSSGKLTVKAGTATKVYKVIATAADGKGAAATKEIKVYGGAIGKITLDNTKTTLYTKSPDASKPSAITVNATITGAGEQAFDPDAYTVTSSNPSIVTAIGARNLTGVAIKIETTGKGYGKANVVIASTDGSNKKATCAVTVSGGITKAEWLDDKGSKISKTTLFRDGTNLSADKYKTTIYAKLTGSDGVKFEGNYKVASSNESLVTVSEGAGKVEGNTLTIPITLKTGSKFTGKATITVEATDGSKKKASFTVTVCNPASRINIAPKKGEMGCVVPGKSVQMTATFETEYGAVSNKKVDWSVDKEVTDSLGITVNSSGKVSIPRGLPLDQLYYVDIYATAKDGSGVVGTGQFYIAPPTTYISLNQPVEKNGVITVSFTSNCCGPMSITSSSPKVASPTLDYTPYKKGAGGSGYFKFVCNQRGTTTFTIKALDGSGKQVKFIIKVT
ncbi:MAG: S8 family serine peptidase [Lachnospiraceae bacterium]|nr:S8 family serine peptidase [Lachnospiraceae bacterium]